MYLQDPPSSSKLLRGQNHMSLPASPATLFISVLATLHSLRRGSWRHAISLRTNITDLITDREHALSSHVVAQSKAVAQIGRRSLPTLNHGGMFVWIAVLVTGCISPDNVQLRRPRKACIDSGIRFCTAFCMGPKASSEICIGSNVPSHAS